MFEHLPEWQQKTPIEQLQALAGAVAFTATTTKSDPTKAVVSTADIVALRKLLREMSGVDQKVDAKLVRLTSAARRPASSRRE